MAVFFARLLLKEGELINLSKRKTQRLRHTVLEYIVEPRLSFTFVTQFHFT